VDEGKPVANAVMQSTQQGAAISIALHQVNLPQRSGKVELPAGQYAGQILQRGLIAWWRQDDALDVVVEVKVGIILPIRPAECWLAHPLPEAVES
jgi:hypothetical protein